MQKCWNHYTNVNGSIPFLWCLQSALTILETTALVVADKSTKSAIAGKKSVSFGQTTATGGLLQSSSCAQPFKPMRLQEKKKNKHHTLGVWTGILVLLQHDESLWACSSGPVTTATAKCNPPIQPESPLDQLAFGVITVSTRGWGSAKTRLSKRPTWLRAAAF